MHDDQTPDRAAFEAQAQQPAPGLVAELLAFLRENKKWWLLPIVLVLLIVGVLLVVASTAAAPLIYPLF